MTVKYMDAKRIQGLSSDTKPTNVPAGSIFVETDTYYYSWYDGTTWTQPARGVFCGGYTGSYVNTMDYIAIQTLGNATDFGDLTTGSYGTSGGGNGTRGVIAIGFDSSSDSDIINYITIMTAGNASDFGDLTIARNALAGGMENDTRLVWSSGNGISSGHLNNIDYVTIMTTGNATDFGDAQTGVYGRWHGVNNGTRGCCAGGYSTSTINTSLGTSEICCVTSCHYSDIIYII
jgi:hypothetical protein